MRSTRLLLLLACLVFTLSARGDLWTNQAGRVIEGKLEAFDGATVTLLRTNGSQFKLPLTALCQTDQQRVRLRTGQSSVPPFVQAAYRDARAVVEQFDRLPEAQRTEEARLGSIRMACAVFDARLQPRLGELKDKNVLQQISQLRASLGVRN